MPNGRLLPIALLGLNQRSPRSGGVTGTVSIAENVIYEKGDSDGLLAQKRKGINTLGNVSSGDPIVGSFGLFGVAEALYQLAENAIYGYVSAAGKWAPIGTQSPGWLSADVEGAGPSYVECTDSAVSASGFRVVAWESLATPRGIYVSLVSPDGTHVCANKQVSADGLRPKVCAAGDVFSISFIRNTTPTVQGVLNAITLQIDGTFSGTITVEAAVSAIDGAVQQGWHDVIARASGTFLFAFPQAGTGNVYTREMSQAGTVGPAVATGGNGDMGGAFCAVDVPGVAGGTYIDIGSINLAGARCIRVDGTTRLNVGTTVVYASAFLRNITGAYDTTTKRTYFAIELADTSGLNLWTNTALVQAYMLQDFSFTTSVICKRSVGLASGALATGTSIIVMCCHAEPLYQPALVGVGNALTQSTFFMIDVVSGNVVGTSLVNQAGGLESMTISEVDTLPHRATLPRLQPDGQDYVVCTKRIAELAAGGVYRAQYRQPVLLRWHRDRTSRPFQADDVTFIPGGMPGPFDGANLTPTFMAAPPALIPSTNAVVTAGVTPLGIGAYSWVYLWAWTDATGDVIRSRPSPPVQLTTTAGNQGAQLKLSTYRLTSLTSATADASNTNMPRAWLEVYRTSLTDPTFRLVSAVDPYPVNNPSVDTYVYTEATGDVAQASGQPLYTLIEVEHTTPPPARAATFWQGRVVLASLDDPGTLFLSFPKAAGFGVTWGELITFRLPGGHVDVIELSVMDDKLVVWCADRVYFVAGQAPNNLGQGGTLTALEVPVQFGLTRPGCVATTDKGLIYWTDNGPYMLGRDGSQNYIGAVVHDVLPAEAMEIVASTSEPRVFVFTSDQGALVWDTVFSTWTTFTNYEAARACEKGGRLYWLPVSENGEVRTSSIDYEDLNGDYISMHIAINDVNFDSIEGYQLCWQCVLLGEYVDEHKLNVDIVYDYRDITAVTQHFERQIGPDFPESFSSSSLYGSLSPYAGSGDGVYQYPMFFRNLYCSAIRLEIWDDRADGDAAPAGGGFRLAALVLEVGTIGGANRIAITKRLSG